MSPSKSGDQGRASCRSLCVATADGLLTQHVLRQPDQASVGAAAGVHPASPAPVADSELHRPSGEDGIGGAGEGAAAAAAAEAPVLEECDRWDVCRHHSWPEREEELPLLEGYRGGAGEGPQGRTLAGPPTPVATVVAWEEGAPQQQRQQQQAWVGQAESVPLVPGAVPLWHDPQFRFFRGPVPGPSTPPRAAPSTSTAF